MNRKNCFYLGQIYGKLATVNPYGATPSRFAKACVYPLNETMQFYLATLQNRLLDKDTETYIALAFNAIDIDDLKQPIDLDLQGTFQI